MNEGPRTLKEIRIDAGLTLEEFADKIGYSKSTAGGYELREASEEYVRKVSEVFNVPLENIKITSPDADHLGPAPPDVSWMLRDYDNATVIEKLHRALMDQAVPLDERVRRAEIFLSELRRRANSETSAVRVTAAVKKSLRVLKSSLPKPQS